MTPHDITPDALSRRAFLATGAVVAALPALAEAADPLPQRQATGVKVGEVTDTSAVVWARLTANPARNADGAKVVGKGAKQDPPLTDDEVSKLPK